MKESYKDWTKIAHVYLADKISKRDPGNTPQSGDRIEFAVIKVEQKGDKLLQGDIIETPSYIKEKNLEIDYLFYLTNQIMNPALQFLELVKPNAIDIFNKYIEKYKTFKPNKKLKTLGDWKREFNKYVKEFNKKRKIKENKELYNFINCIKPRNLFEYKLIELMKSIINNQKPF